MTYLIRACHRAGDRLPLKLHRLGIILDYANTRQPHHGGRCFMVHLRGRIVHLIRVWRVFLTRAGEGQRLLTFKGLVRIRVKSVQSSRDSNSPPPSLRGQSQLVVDPIKTLVETRRRPAAPAAQRARRDLGGGSSVTRGLFDTRL